MTISDAAWRDGYAAQRETLRIAAAERASAASRERFQQRVTDAKAEIAATPPASTQRLLDIRV